MAANPVDEPRVRSLLSRESALEPEVRAAALVLALGAAGRADELRGAARVARDLGVPAAVLLESARMVHLFAGFPRAIEAFTLLEEAGVAVDPGDAATAPGVEALPPEGFGPRGEAAFARVYGDGAERVRARLRRLDPTLERAIVEDAYGRILARRGVLDARARELAAVCALTVQELPRQLDSHVRGALRCGATASDVAESITLAEAVAGPRAANAARRLLDLVPDPE